MLHGFTDFSFSNPERQESHGMLLERVLDISPEGRSISTSKDSDPFPQDARLLENMLNWARDRIIAGPDPKNGAKSFEVLDAALGHAIRPEGLGGHEAFELFTQTIAPSSRPFDHPTSLSFVAAAPTPAALGFDAALGAAEIFAGNWDGGSGAIHAENQALRWIADLAGWPQSAGGTFVAGGTLGNLSALHAARSWRERQLGGRPNRWRLIASEEVHSSIAAVARVMDVELTLIPTNERGRMYAETVRTMMGDTSDVFAILANAGATNCGAVDDLKGLAELAEEHGLWLHVDGAYGLAAAACPEARFVFDGIEGAHSLIVDPHKWLFAPYDSCALIYRNVADGAAAHGQRAAYLDAVMGPLNPSDYALHLSRRARGLPLWFSLATYGTNAYARAISQVLERTHAIANGISSASHLELLFPPQLSVILFRRPGMDWSQMMAWAEQHRRSGALLCLPTRWQGEPVFRLCLVNPATDPEYVLTVLKTLE